VASSVDSKLRFAIAGKRLVTFTAEGCPRKAEPHDYGIFKGVARLLYYQVGGQSRSGKLPGWRWAKVAGISDLSITDEVFAGPRAVNGRHVAWEKVFASVSKKRG
jgi:hypothetical protein